MERYIAVDGVCAWPNLTLAADGTILAVIYNRPRHGDVEGEVVCWGSVDGGMTWEVRGTPVLHDPGTSRINCACGLARDGSLVVLVSGWYLKAWQTMPRPTVCRSSDGGFTWERGGAVEMPDRAATVLVPFGDVIRLPDASLGACLYGFMGPWRKDVRHGSYFFRSADDGRTWLPLGTIREADANETFALPLADGSLLAVARTGDDEHLDTFRSADGGETWESAGPATLGGQHPGHLLRLADGRVLLTYGIRSRGLRGVGARFYLPSERRWDSSMVLVDFRGVREGGYPENVRMKPDCGYPSSVQLADGTVVTAYYASKVPCHHRYHMGVIRWKVDEEF